MKRTSLPLLRRAFIAGLGAAAAWPLAAPAQQSERMRRIGWLGPPKDHPYHIAAVAAFRQELARLGWLEGHNIAIEQRSFSGDGDQYTRDAKELVALAP